MPFYVRKRIKIAPGLNLNLSKSGLGLSAGVKGFRVSKGPRGTQINAGRGGIYYRTSLGSQRRRRRAQGASTEMVPGYDVQATLSVRDHDGHLSARAIDPSTLTDADLARVNVVVLDEYAYRRRVNAATLLYLCGWVPGVIANWRLRKEMRGFQRQYGVRPPWMRVVGFQFWVFTVVPAAIIVLAIL